VSGCSNLAMSDGCRSIWPGNTMMRLDCGRVTDNIASDFVI
jgi:hypothetical protein